MRVLESLNVTIPGSEVRRLLGSEDPDSESTPQIERMISEMIEECERLASPKAVYGFFSKAEIKQSDFLGGEQDIALAVCTIGQAVEEKVARLSSASEITRAVTLDAAASVCAEACADTVNGIICREAHEMGFFAEPRFSPGYGGWELRGQRFVFNLLPAEKIGVRLNDSFMMIPRKSVSFAVRLLKEQSLQSTGSPCSRCGLKNCRMRKG